MGLVVSDEPTDKHWPGNKEPLRALLLLPDRDVHGADWSGAFRVEMERMAAALRLPPSARVQIDVSRDRAARRAQVRRAIEGAGEELLDLVVLCGHGWATGCQLGYDVDRADELARLLAAHGTARLSVVLYACSTAAGGEHGEDAPGCGGDGGLADRLRDALCRAGSTWARVDAHDRAGHCCSNPYVRRMEGRGRPEGGQGGEWLVVPGSPLWPRWVAELEDRHHSTLRFRFPLLDRDTLRTELLSP